MRLFCLPRKSQISSAIQGVGLKEKDRVARYLFAMRATACLVFWGLALLRIAVEEKRTPAGVASYGCLVTTGGLPGHGRGTVQRQGRDASRPEVLSSPPLMPTRKSTTGMRCHTLLGILVLLRTEILKSELADTELCPLRLNLCQLFISREQRARAKSTFHVC